MRKLLKEIAQLLRALAKGFESQDPFEKSDAAIVYADQLEAMEPGYWQEMLEAFPGLVNGYQDVDGGDLIQWISERAANPDRFDPDMYD